MNYGPSRKSKEGYSVRFIAEDCRTPISRYCQVRSKASLRDLIVRTKASEAILADFDHALDAWGQGSVWMQLTEAQLNALSCEHSNGPNRV